MIQVIEHMLTFLVDVVTVESTIKQPIIGFSAKFK